MRRLRGFTFVEMLAAVSAAGVLVAVVLPTLGSRRAKTRRAVCTRNLQLASSGLSAYAQAYGGALPTCGYGPGTKRFDVIGWRFTQRRSLAHSNSRNLFLAVRGLFVDPAALICPETDDQPAWLGPPTRPYHDFNVGHGDYYTNRFSYSYHLQFRDRSIGERGYPLTTASEPGMAVLADRNPCLSYSGRAWGSGSAADSVGAPPGVDASAANSRNHAGRGQNVAFLDGHVRWAAAPTVGPDGDNIYTVWFGSDRANGEITYRSMPRGRTDCFLVP